MGKYLIPQFQQLHRSGLPHPSGYDLQGRGRQRRSNQIGNQIPACYKNYFYEARIVQYLFPYFAGMQEQVLHAPHGNR